jgi:Protein of unknown function (DUF2442)
MEQEMNNKMITPVNAIYVGGYKLLIEFENHEVRIADMKYLLNEELPDFPEIKDEEYFKNFELDMMGGLCWPNGYDIAPDYLYTISKPAVINALF